MTKIICKECEKKIDDTNKQCPHCGYKLKKNYLSIILISIIVIIPFILLIVFNSNSMTQEEKVVYNAIINNKNDFKDPSSVKLLDAQYCSDKSLILTINAKNSYGGYEQETYYVYNENLLEKMNFDDILETYKDDKDELRRQYYIYQAYEKSVKNVEQDCENNEIIYLSEKSIKKINNKLK